MAEKIGMSLEDTLRTLKMLDHLQGVDKDDDYLYILGLFKTALYWFYSRKAGISYPLPSGDGWTPSDTEVQIGYFFDSVTKCAYITGVFLDSRQHISQQLISYVADTFLPRTCQIPLYSLQFEVECNPETHRPLSDEIERALEALVASKRWDTDPQLVMAHPLIDLPSLSDDLEFIEMLNPGEQVTREHHFTLFEAYELICSLAFEYPYSADITECHFAIGDPSQEIVRYVRNIVRRKSDGLFVGIGSYLWGVGLGVGYISEIAVRPDCQKQGIGVFLINAVMKSMRDRRLKRAVLTSSKAGQALYFKTGFSVQNRYLSYLISNELHTTNP